MPKLAENCGKPNFLPLPFIGAKNDGKKTSIAAIQQTKVKSNLVITEFDFTLVG